MKNLIGREGYKLLFILSTILFFITAIFLFSIYSIDLSSLVLIAILAVYLRYFYKQKDLPSLLDRFLLVALAVLIVVLTIDTFKLSPYSVSAIGFILLVTILFNNLQLSILFSLVISSLAAGTQEGYFGWEVGITLLCASLSAAMLSYRVRTRFMIIRAGLLAGVIQFFVAFIAEHQQELYSFSLPDVELLKVCLIGGFVSSIVVIGVLPVFEYIFRVVTNVSLLELSGFNNPILKKMVLEAPGTRSEERRGGKEGRARWSQDH